MRFKRKKEIVENTTVHGKEAATVMTAAPTHFHNQFEAKPSRAPPHLKPPSRPPPPQIIEDRYIDDDKLLELCSKRFPSGSYRLSVRHVRQPS